ncbi:spermidine synthase [Agromyces sp. MMS24-K17]|uniref:spermidine synthase n=1 Tax=Agromyces sp. MMS24-K17 TaxID=3372850 RepID=UPI003753FB7C
MGRIEFEADVFSPSGLTLLVDDVAQSHVDPADPTRLFFEYAQRIGHVLDAVADPGAPIGALHLGGGAFTLPRYVEATRPGSHQVVVEHDADLLRIVLDRLPLPRGADIETVVADASRAVRDLAGRPLVDVVVLDLYTGLVPPGFVTDVPFLSACLDRLAPHGVLVANVADAAGLDRLRALARAIARARPAAELLVAGDANVVSTQEEGNTVLVAAPDGLPRGLEERLRAKGPFPVEVLTGPRLDFVLWDAC